ncbi:MAG: succinylglutamate desuccinylase [Desulfuromonas sp.]|nr:MAG: succinylglutamate desuccinylase [Desulfuromonas sp.]
MSKHKAFVIGGVNIEPGQSMVVDLPVSVLSNHIPVTMPVYVKHGKLEGPTVFVSAAIHGDEVIGVEIIRRLIKSMARKRLHGTLLCIPIVNAFGFISHSRYLPDRRDLNRCFPGNSKGSLAGQLAKLFMEEIVSRCDFGIDLHSAAQNRNNLPQIRISSNRQETVALAEAFGAPVIVQAGLREGSLRYAAKKMGVDVLLYEGGEGLRFDELTIRVGLTGILRILRSLGALSTRSVPPAKNKSYWSQISRWTRAPEGGILRCRKKLGDIVAKGEVVGVISDPFGNVEFEVQASNAGLVIGKTNLPIVNQGDALYHVAELTDKKIREPLIIEQIEKELMNESMYDEDEII